MKSVPLRLLLLYMTCEFSSNENYGPVPTRRALFKFQVTSAEGLYRDKVKFTFTMFYGDTFKYLIKHKRLLFKVSVK